MTTKERQVVRVGRAIQTEVKNLQAAQTAWTRTNQPPRDQKDMAAAKRKLRTAEQAVIAKAEQFFPGLTVARVSRCSVGKYPRYLELLTELVEIQKI